MLLTGLRGVGKTVLLREFRRLADRHRWVAPRDRDHRRAEVRRGNERTRECGAASAVAGQTQWQSTGAPALGVLKSFQLKWKLPDGGDVVIGLDPVPGPADSGLLDRDLAGLFLEIGAVARARGVGILVTIDEVQNLPREHLGALMVALHRVSQEQLPVMAAAAGLPTVPRSRRRGQDVRRAALSLQDDQQPRGRRCAGGSGAAGGCGRGSMGGGGARSRPGRGPGAIPTSSRSSASTPGTPRAVRTRSRSPTWRLPCHAPPESWMRGSSASASTGPAGRNRLTSPSWRLWERRLTTFRSPAASRRGAMTTPGSGERPQTSRRSRRSPQAPRTSRDGSAIP